ncbi:unnamed protein product [Paramecium primaurelia]|uniref:Uncharacterized protein n=1 Tax=Paramecium primaurelia TaxID=5886 RepID=A0A8S1JQP5_PARPR|nr:unnamed protein product [Paramecium primaurelia]
MKMDLNRKECKKIFKLQQNLNQVLKYQHYFKFQLSINFIKKYYSYDSQIKENLYINQYFQNNSQQSNQLQQILEINQKKSKRSQNKSKTSNLNYKKQKCYSKWLCINKLRLILRSSENLRQFIVSVKYNKQDIYVERTIIKFNSFTFSLNYIYQKRLQEGIKML